MLDNICLFLSKTTSQFAKASVISPIRVTAASVAMAALTACGGGGGGGGGGSSSCSIATPPNILMPLSNNFSITYKDEKSADPVVVKTGAPISINSRCIAPLQLQIGGQEVEEFLESDAQGIRLWGYKIKNYSVSLLGLEVSFNITATLESPFTLYDAENPDNTTLLGGEGQAFLKLEGANEFTKSKIPFLKQNLPGINLDRFEVPFITGRKLEDGTVVSDTVSSFPISFADVSRQNNREIKFFVSIDLKELGDRLGIPALSVYSDVDLVEGLGIYTRELHIDSFSARADFKAAQINANDADCDGYLDVVDDDSSDATSPSTTSRTVFNSSCRVIK